ncbi:hypothetical protein CEXT_240931 [Caerostris extrusa]|uniref:Uncharacterized protein n=1 Tax=Caerostris extrusa TaxID=172846 RepID=A0AAV4XGU6_CAEEX|nr:hypothetical protein CEXT_240931 [Caerostris extrusa]
MFLFRLVRAYYFKRCTWLHLKFTLLENRIGLRKKTKTAKLAFVLQLRSSVLSTLDVGETCVVDTSSLSTSSQNLAKTVKNKCFHRKMAPPRKKRRVKELFVE